MRYKQDLAEFLPIADGARLIQERAGITEDKAREDIVAFVRDHASKVRWFRVNRSERHQCYRSDLPHGFLDSLTPNHIDWGTSIARRRSVYSPFTVEIEVKRDALSQLYSLLDDDGDREGSTIGAMEEEPTATEEPKPTRRNKLAKPLHDSWVSQAKVFAIQTKKDGNSVNVSRIASTIERQNRQIKKENAKRPQREIVTIRRVLGERRKEWDIPSES